MSDFYTEQLVKQKTKAKSTVIMAGMIAVTVLSFILVVLIPYGIIAPLVLIVVDTQVAKRLNLEFEYLYVNGDLDIDKIMAKSRRKRIFSTNVREIEVVAPKGSVEVHQYQNLKAKDYSSNQEGNSIYEMIVIRNGEKIRVFFEPNKTILDGIKMMAPRKVFV